MYYNKRAQSDSPNLFEKEKIMDDFETLEEWANKKVEIQIKAVDRYCNEYQKIKEETMKYIAELESNGLKVIRYTIKKEK